MSQDSPSRQQKRRDFFISYANSDQQWAEWIAFQLEEAGYTLFLRAWDFRPGSNIVAETDQAAQFARQTLLILSSALFQSDETFIEWAATLHQDPRGVYRKLLPVRVEACEVPGLLGPIIPIDLISLDEVQARERLLAGIQSGRAKLLVAAFPNIPREAPLAVPFPGVFPTYWNIPVSRNPFFTGRKDLLERLHTQLQTLQVAVALGQSQAISGLGGIGKTQLAIEYVYRYRAEYQAVLWARAETAEALTTSYTHIARVLDLPQQDTQEQEVIVQAVKKWLLETSGWLLILDNADDLNVVQSFFPPAQHGHLLLTTRSQVTGKIAQRFDVEPLDAQTGALLVLRRAGMLTVDASFDAASEADQSLALALAQEMGGLPLALDQAGAYVEETQCGLADYFQQYQTCSSALLAQRGRLVDDHPEPVATTWALSFAQVEAASPLAAALLRACAFLAPDAIPEELLYEVLKIPPSSLEHMREPAGWFSWFPFRFHHKRPSPLQSGDELNQAVAILRTYSLIQRYPGEKMVSVHRLVQAIVRDALEDHEQLHWITRIITAVNELFPSGDFESWGKCVRYLPQALACASWIAQRNLTLLEGASLLNRTGQYLDNRASYTDAEQLYQQALLIRTQRLGVAHPHTGNILNNLAVLYDTQRRYSEAEPLYQQSLAISEQQLGATHPNTASSLNNLAALYLQQEKYEQAEPLLKRALMIREQQLGPTHSDVARSLSNLALLELRQGNDDVAEMLWQRVLAIYEQQAEATQPDIGRSLNNLALLYWSQGRYYEAEPLLKRAVLISEQQLGVEHPDTMLIREHYLSLTQLVQQEPDGMKVRDELR
jgi:tetratricopeptide (TPR) repeat protein